MRSCIGIRLVLTALIVLVFSTPAFADVLEIHSGGAVWVAGGPVSRNSDTPTDVSPGAAEASTTFVSQSAGPAQWSARVARVAAKYDVSPRLLEAVIWQESRWRTSAVSPAGARGLAQLMPGTARQMGIDPKNPDANLEGGARYLRMQLDAFDGNLEKALAAYNAGPRRVQEAGGIPRIRETRNYVASIMARLTEPDRR